MALTAGIVGAGAAAASAGVGISNALGGSSKPSAGGSNLAQNAYQPTGYQQAQYGNQYFQNVGAIDPYALNYPGQTIPQFQNLTSQIINNPYAGSAQNAANQIYSTGMGTVAPMQLAGANALAGLGGLSAGVAPQLIQSGFDPQNALYARQFQQMQDQTNAINAMYGVGASPYGAGLASQAAQNFNIDWQNQQLARQLQATQGLGNLTTAAGRGYAGASDLGGAALSTMGTAGAAPYAQYNVPPLAGLSALTTQNQGVSGAFQPTQLSDQAIAAILGLGNTGQIANFGQGQTMGSNIGQSLSGLTSALNNPALQSGINQLFAPNASDVYSNLVTDQNFGMFLP